MFGEDGTGACSNGNAAVLAAVHGTVPDGKYSGGNSPSACRRDLVAFLRALTDTASITEKRLSNPWADTLRKVRAR